MTKHPEVTHSSSSLGSIKPMGLRFFKVALCDLEACSSDKARLIASSWARVLSLMSFWSARISFTSSLSLYSSWAKVTTFSGRVENVSICRIATNALVILMLVSSATGLRSTLDSIKAPSSVKAYGRDFLGRFILDVITNCDEIRLHSCSVNWNIKSLGNLLALRLTVWLRDLVSTSYSIARSKSSITRCPRMMYMRSWIFCNSSIVVLLLPLQN